MNEKVMKKKIIYLVSIHLTELVFITKAKNEKEAKIFVARYLIKNKSIYKNLTDFINAPNYLDYFIAIQLSTATRITENASSEEYVSNVARMISDLDKTDNLRRFWDGDQSS